ncbi:inorganic phosphate transporter [Lawsonibacter celer]|uniref:inorganic phosphate transporter n=1 Tax=Lawsonibacter celer TaxID=2986526 RepID=UPI0016484F05|nr:inorganic phosphate transporter [Lawsonibacter celer]
MSESFCSFLSCAAQDPVLALTVLLTLAVVLVNGWTDAPNAIATVVSTGGLTFRRAAWLAAGCNLLGTLVMTGVSPAVAETLYSIAGFGGSGRQALSALCAALCAIVLWAVLAWRFGVPTSESHALVAGVTGAALAMPGGAANLNAGAWVRVLLGLLLSVLLGWLCGAGWSRLLSRRGRRRSFRRAQIAGSAAMAFLHGAQDGQKFIGIFLLGTALAGGGPGRFAVPLWPALLCAGVMALGTRIGGRRIIETVGRDMTALSPRSGFAADLGGGCVLLLCTLLGLPVSTTHAKTAAILGAGREDGGWVDRTVVRSVGTAWLLTFPCCGGLGFLLARVFLLFSL